ncbi:DEK domain-containing chromatin-associated protein 2 isoform X1 [Physcomitrium patens]|uniref:DEK-C domain-containing protein n=1 Tax=Physcomitrium patens TaxID=3218 RepID=A0A7I4ARD5_PHYPA|nr:eukaryotic translation initiation factor 5B-like isoform X1 [Physcomitrium patens]|eukprot:XP_024394557.1 eukaryotic translation initiation factor 5B-like isoform X1 [Physcomitrella patens]
MSHDPPSTASDPVLLHPEPRPAASDQLNNASSVMDEEKPPPVSHSAPQGVVEQPQKDINPEEVAGTVLEGSSEKPGSGAAAQAPVSQDDRSAEGEEAEADDDGEKLREAEGEGDDEDEGEEAVVEQEKKQRGRKKRPEKVKKESTDDEVEQDVKTPKRGQFTAEKKAAASFASDRPTRERKTIDRFIASAEKDNTKELEIKQGDGTPLKDIPNVVYKLSKRFKHDETLSQLHSILFNKRGKAAVLKRHILQFSGYVWSENKEKERAKIQEKLERYTKDSLVQFVDVLDIHVSKTLKKEDLVAKVLEFLEKPHRTTDTLLEFKNQERTSLGKRSSSGKKPGRPKIQKAEGKSTRKRERKKASDDADSDNSEKDIDGAIVEEESEKKRLDFKDDTDNDESMDVEKEQVRDSSTVIEQDSEERPAEEEGNQVDKEVHKPPRKKSKVGAHDVTRKSPSKAADRVYSKKLKAEASKRVSSSTASKQSRKTPGKKNSLEDNDAGKKSIVKGGESNKSAIPSDGELQAKIRELLREADFSKVTFTDVVSQLERIFGVSLVERKGHVKGLIRDEISKLTEAEEESEKDAEETAEDE